MREKINRLAKGIVDTEVLKISIIPESVEETVHAGQLIRGELYVTGEENQHIKGLIYSSDIRVRVLNESFGGIRNHIIYEVDTRQMEQGEDIAGAFYLVTNAGEKKVEYRFTAELGATGTLLSSLKTPEDFAKLAEEDCDTALRLFEYKDFTDAPFMQDIHIATLYQAMKGRSGKPNLLEEFLVELKAKAPVTFRLNTVQFSLFCGEEPPKEQKLELIRSGWGHVRIELQADGDFIELPVNVVTDSDFEGERCEITFRIIRDKLHYGKNMGSVICSTVRQSSAARIEVQNDTRKERERHSVFADEYGKYLEYRLDYESGLYEDRLLLNQMQQEVERFKHNRGESPLISLLQAELCVMEGRKDRAAVVLEGCAEQINQMRQKEVLLYCYYLYVQFLIQKKEGQRDSLIRLLRKHLMEGPEYGYLFFLWLKLEPSLADNPAELLARMRQLYAEGCHSPFLYVEAYKVFNRLPDMLRSIDGFELQVLYFCTRKDMIEESLALRVAKLAANVKRYNRLIYRLLVRLYEKYPCNALLEAVCGMLIRGDCRGTEYFSWYQKALDGGLNLTRLYEYYLYALPKDYPYLLPKEVLLYFSYVKDMDRHSRSVLYMNILRYMKPEAKLYRQYEREMEQFAMQQLFESRINSRLAVIYRHILYREMIDEQVAKVLPAILKSYRVRCKNPNMKYVIVVYEEIDGEDAFPLKDGVAYVPLFSQHSILLFQDAYGNRYANIPYRKQQVMKQEDTGKLEERCFEVYPGHPMLRLQECSAILDRGISGEKELTVLERAASEMALNQLYRKKMFSQIIEYYRKASEMQDGDINVPDASYLLYLDAEGMSRKERSAVCGTLIRQDYMREAYGIIEKFGYRDVEEPQLLRLCCKMILQNLFDQNKLLLHMAFDVFGRKRYDGVVLDYLCEHYNGMAEQMYEVLKLSVKEQVETYDMEERLLAQMLFSGEDRHMDEVFALYSSRKKTSDQVVRAYFTARCIAYFLEDKQLDDKVFDYLERAVSDASDLEKVPTIYLLALSKHYAFCRKLNDEQKRVCGLIVDSLLAEGKIFPYFRRLGNHIAMPQDIMDKVMFSYRSSRNAKPELQVRVLPDEENYHSEDMQRVYQGIFVKQKMLFEGETLEYRIYETKNETCHLMKEGSLGGEQAKAENGDFQFARLNEMSAAFLKKDEETLKKTMEDYAVKRAAARRLFPLA